MLKKITCTVLFLSVCSAWGLLAQDITYRSELLSELAEKNVSAQKELGRMDIITEYDAMGRVSNIGLDIFDLEVSELLPEDVCEFISRYFLELLCWDKTSMQQKIKDDDVIFLTGIPEDALKLNSGMSFSLDRIEDKRYVATWKDDEKTVLSFSFPIQYELILGMPQVEIEQKLLDDLNGFDAVPSIDTDFPETEMMGNGLFRSIPATHFFAKELTDCKYYLDSMDGSIEPVFDDAHIAESAANLFQNIIERDYTLSIRQSLYGFEKKDFDISLSQWLAYCKKNHLKSYFAVEKEDEKSILALIICESRDLAFNHMLSVAIPKTFIKDSDIILKAKLNAYIPTHNISELYQDQETRADEY